MVMFGFSHSLQWAIFSRGTCGILNGNIGVAKSVLGEITTAKNRGAAFSMLGLNYGIGMIVGPFLGGLLSWPDRAFPELFGGVQLFIDNPFLLPCVASSAFSFGGFIIAYMFLPETLRREVVEDEIDIVGRVIPENTLLIDSDTINDCYQSNFAVTRDDTVVSSEIDDDLSTMPLLGKQRKEDSPISIQFIIGYSLIAFENIIFIEIFPLWAIAKSPVGLGFSAADIGILLASVGAIAIVCQLLIYPIATQYYSALTLYRVPVIVVLITTIFLPIIPIFLTSDDNIVLYWTVLVFVMGLKEIAENFVFTSIMVLVKFD
jgi:MFS family permease